MDKKKKKTKPWRCKLPNTCFLIAGRFIQKVANFPRFQWGSKNLLKTYCFGGSKSFLTSRNIQSSSPLGHSVSEWFRLSSKASSIIKPPLITSYIFWKAVTPGAVGSLLTMKCWPCPDGWDDTICPPSALSPPAPVSPSIMILNVTSRSSLVTSSVLCPRINELGRRVELPPWTRCSPRVFLFTPQQQDTGLAFLGKAGNLTHKVLTTSIAF